MAGAANNKSSVDTSGAVTPGGKGGNQKKVDDEHLPGAEADIPLDGRDEVGEAMIRDLPTRTKTSDQRG